MDPSGINNFEEQWRKALSEASETPPKSIWENIEARLDEENEKGMVLPLWWQSKKLWLAAASVAALLIVGAELWNADRNAGNSNAEVAVSKSAKTAEQEPKAPEPATVQEENTAVADANTSQAHAEQSATARSKSIASASKPRKNSAPRHTAPVAPETGSESAIARVNKSRVPAAPDSKAVQQSFAPEKQNTMIASAPAGPEAAKIDPADQQSLAVAMLPGRAYSDLDVHFQKRYVFFRPDAIAEEDIKPAQHREYWAGVGIMPASFNPDLQVKQTPQAFSYQALSNRKAVSGTSQAGVSYALQTQGGVRLSKHWSVELGLSYLRGNSSYQGGGYLLNAYSQSANVLEDALASASPRPSFSTEKNFNNGAIYIDVSKAVSNNYQYLQMPVQAGFTLNPDKKLSYSLLGGMMANFFLSNDLESASGEIITTTASDEIYRSMNWAATTGLRFNYKLSTKWKASLTGSYQKAVSSGFRSNQTLDARPYLYGVSWGVRYSF